MTREDKRALFERGIEVLNRGEWRFPLTPMNVNGKFHRYIDSDTDSAWIGFQLACNALQGATHGDATPTTTPTGQKG